METVVPEKETVDDVQKLKKAKIVKPINHYIVKPKALF